MTRSQISEFYNVHKGRLYNASLRIVGNSMEAEEVMQDTIIKFIRLDEQNSPSLPYGEEKISAWLMRTCVRASIDVIRKKRRSDLFLEDYKLDIKDEEAVEQEGSTEWNEMVIENEKTVLVRKIREALDRLSDGYRTVVSLVLFEGMDYAEVSQILDLKEASVRSQYMRGRLKLIEEIKRLSVL